jgi:exonuclease VII small subunit
MNLGNALSMLGERESGTARLEEAVAAYRDALQEARSHQLPCADAPARHR